MERESGPGEDDAPVAPPIPSFESLRAPRRRSAIDLLFPPAEAPTVEAPVEAPVEEPAAVSTPTAPRPAEWGDLLHLGTRLGSCAVRLVADGATRGLAGVRALLRG